MDFAVRDIEWEGHPFLQMQGLKDQKRVHLMFLPHPDRATAIARAERNFRNRGASPCEVSAEDWIEPRQRRLWDQTTFFGYSKLEVTDQAALASFYARSPIHHDALGAHVRLLLKAQDCRAFAAELLRVADMLEQQESA
jgi:hypothetical protein